MSMSSLRLQNIHISQQYFIIYTGGGEPETQGSHAAVYMRFYA